MNTNLTPFIKLMIAVLMASSLSSQAVEKAIEPESYHGEPYLSAVPATLKGAEVLSDERAYELWNEKQTYFVDVLPRAPKPAGLPEDTLWIDHVRLSIKGSYWLPNTGYQRIAEFEMTYFIEGLSQITNGNTKAPVVFFCQANCWMSWNAAKRALEVGYQRVYWYPDGTDGWEKGSYPMEEIEPLIVK